MAMATEIPEDVIKEVERLTAQFIWNGSSKVAGEKIAKAWEDGGMGMPMIREIVSAAAMHWIRRALFNQEKVWAKNIIMDL